MAAMDGPLCRKWSPGENQLMVEINHDNIMHAWAFVALVDCK